MAADGLQGWLRGKCRGQRAGPAVTPPGVVNLEILKLLSVGDGADEVFQLLINFISTKCSNKGINSKR